ncbi:MAG: ATP-binding protein [Chloroflexi bacterium]|nr:ATP-binding protein [Chloroflexota bacterium]
MIKQLFSSLRSRLILLVLLASLPALGLTLYSGLEQRQLAVLSAEQDTQHIAYLTAVNQKMFVENTRAFLLAMSHLPALRDQDIGACQHLFSHILTEHYPYYLSFYVADLKGNVVCNPPNTHVPDHLTDCTHYNRLLQVKDFTVSDYHICESTGKAIISMGYPILDDQGKLVLVLNISLDLKWINQLAADADLPEGAALALYDRKGVILAHYPEPDAWVGKSALMEPTLSDLLEVGEGRITGPGPDGVERLYIIRPMPGSDESVRISLGFPTAAVFAQANQLMLRNLLLLGGVTLLAVLAAWVLSDILVVRRAKALVAATRRLADGDLSARAGVAHDQGELGQLAHAFDHMAEAIAHHEAERDRAEQAIKEYAAELEHSNRELQDFANIASHDLQEPLRKIQTFSELLQTRHTAQLDERGLNYLDRMHQAARRMQTLVDELLAYSRVTTRAQPFKSVDLQDVLRSVLSDLDFQIEESGAHIETQPLPTIIADPTQMRQLFQNLIGNALKFHKPGQPPDVEISARDLPPTPASLNGALCEITFSDQGIGFDEKYLDRIFQPFQRLHGSGAYSGVGMGLTICRKIADRHNGEITARSAPGKGASFTVRLPLSQPSGEPSL